ncbi:hypothetical protein DFS34DRAFT_86326 [Phlyctochytrium arcticum]|nr:hypothetical protein DFS34DRAFT_86326 [Phlyctochytrium arcticum]
MTAKRGRPKGSKNKSNHRAGRPWTIRNRGGRRAQTSEPETNAILHASASNLNNEMQGGSMSVSKSANTSLFPIFTARGNAAAKPAVQEGADDTNQGAHNSNGTILEKDIIQTVSSQCTGSHVSFPFIEPASPSSPSHRAPTSPSRSAEQEPAAQPFTQSTDEQPQDPEQMQPATESSAETIKPAELTTDVVGEMLDGGARTIQPDMIGELSN